MSFMYVERKEDLTNDKVFYNTAQLDDVVRSGRKAVAYIIREDC